MNTEEERNIFPSSDEIDEANKLLTLYERGEQDENMNLERKISETEKKSGVSRQDWKLVNYPGNKGGISDTAIGNKISSLKVITSGGSLSDLKKSVNFKPRSFPDALSKCQETLRTAELFIKNPFKGLKGNTDNSIEESKGIVTGGNNNELDNTKWAAYFLYYKEDDTHNEVNEALIGRAIVEVDSSLGSLTPVLFKNIEFDSVVNYSGNYTTHMDLDHGIVIFDLEPQNGKERARNIHIKVFCRSPEQHILLGQYTTFEKGYIQSGNIIFKNLKDQKENKLETGVYSFIHNHNSYNDDTIPDAFRIFLSERLTNYNILKLHNIRTEKALQVHVDNYRPSDNSKYERFLERYKPRVFISMPTSEKSYTIASDIKDHLDEVFKNQVYISFKRGDMPAKKDLRGERQPFRDIEKLKTTRFFVLIMDNPETLSYSYLQLGIAITVCKVAIVITKKEFLSSSLNKLRNSVLKKIYYQGNLENEIENVSKELSDYLKNFLPNYQGGNIEVL